jgi:phospholipase/carboxylesterase
MQEELIFQRPIGPATQLVLLFHGVGSDPDDLRPLGEALARRFDNAWVVGVRSPDASDIGSGWQWFSVRGIDEDNRPARVGAAMPRFVQTVQKWQHKTGLGAADTTLIGFSQGAIMSLESTQESAPPAGRVIAIAGRFAQPPRVAPAQTTLHLLQGEQDRVIPSAWSIHAIERLRELGAKATLDLIPALGHAIDQRVLDRLVERMLGREPALLKPPRAG